MANDEINWQGGQVEVTRADVSGWNVEYRTADGRKFSADWAKQKSAALQAAKTIAKQRNAKLLVEAA